MMMTKAVKDLLSLRSITWMFAGLLSASAWASSAVNIYSARHYQSDDKLYAAFSKRTGIQVNRIEAADEALLERLRSEGSNSPADVLILVDAARLSRAAGDGLFAASDSDLLRQRIPESLRSAKDSQGYAWWGFSKRARIIVYNKQRFGDRPPLSYAALAEPRFKSAVCTRSAAHPYMLSLIAAQIEHRGESAALAWAKGVVANFARPPRGGDTDQIRATASGECGLALSNTYYLARLMRSTKPEDQEIISKVGFIWPDQDGVGTHVNVTGGGIAKHAKNREAAIRFLEFMASDEAQQMLADGNNEWPAVPSVKLTNPALDAMGPFKADKLAIASIGARQSAAVKLVDQAGW
ncbi:MAG: extracellular solute-binding protein, partial [Betaproteobacteria bacterium]|nr:extracellular solute-binding protein [Betaproteobacteria bacterium]